MIVVLNDIIVAKLLIVVNIYRYIFQILFGGTASKYVYKI